MKKYLVLVFLIFLISNLNAFEIQIKDSFQKDSCLDFFISGNFVDSLSNENFLLYRENVRIPSLFQVLKVDYDYYITTSLLDKSPGNYSILIKDVKYYRGNQVLDDDVRVDFKITNISSQFHLNPCLIITDNDFIVKVQNLAPSRISLSLSLNNTFENQMGTQGFFSSLFSEPESSKIKTNDKYELRSGEMISIKFNVAGKYNVDSLQKITFSTSLSSYSLPVFIYVNDSSPSKAYLSSNLLKFEPINHLTFISGQEDIFPIYLLNEKQNVARNINLSVSKSLEEFISFDLDSINKLDPSSSIKLDLKISSKEGLSKNVSGYINAFNESGILAQLQVNINFIPSQIDEHGNKIIINNSVSIPDDLTTRKNEGISPWSVMGWILLIGIIGFGLWYYFFKIKKTASPKKDLLEIARKKD